MQKFFIPAKIASALYLLVAPEALSRGTHRYSGCVFIHSLIFGSLDE
nr:MAG TPA: hypothetical protein [Bacteriophage sp.]